MQRRKTKKVYFGDFAVGGDAPISVQSMTNTKTDDISSTVSQIRELSKHGCELIRVAVPDKKSAYSLSKIKKEIDIPLIADIHFNHRLALIAIDEGIDGLRINPGNIGDEEKVKEVIKAARIKKIPVRVGVNAGSLERTVLEKYGHPSADAMVESAMHHIKILEENDFHDIVISLKSSDVLMTIEAYEKMAQKTDYPFHIGITEAGTIWAGAIKSSVGIGSLLMKGLGDTMRISLTGDPVEEVKTAWMILKSLKIRKNGPEIISCPTCGRTEIDLIKVAREVEEALRTCKKNITVAVMGCAVNGPGEAREADIGLAGGKGEGILFKKGKVIKKVREEKLVESLLEEIEKM